jgi:hypothetical protein
MKLGTRPEGSAFIVLTDSWRKISLQELQPETAFVVLNGWSKFDDLQP